MNDTDLDLERRLRAHFRDARTTDAAPLALRADVMAIPRTAGVTAARARRRRGLTLLAAMVALGAGAAGLAVLTGGRTPENPRPSPPAIAIAPSPTPSRSSDPALSPGPSGSPDGTGPATVDVPAPGLAAGWQAAGTMSEPRILPTATRLQDGRVLVVGGIASDGTAVATAEVWDPVARTFSPAGSLSRPRIGHAATLLQDGRVLIVGGEDGVEPLPEMAAEVWDPATSRFGAVGSMLRLPSGLSATTLLDGRVLIVGRGACVVPRVVDRNNFRQCPFDGLDVDNPNGANEVETWLWDPRDGTAAPGPKPLESREWHTATLLPDGRVLFVGNTGWSSDDPESSEVYDPTSGTFIRVAEPRDLVSSAQTATLLRDGRVLITGGDTSDPNGDPNYMGPLRTAETWDPVSGTFRRAGRMEVARRAHQAALLPDGRVIVVGGSGERTQNFFDPSTATSEVWDPATGSFSPGPQMADKRARFGLIRLLDGSLLAIGGDARLDARHDKGTALASAEILDFTPSN